MKNYCRQKDINYIENANISKDCLCVKKLHLTQKGYSCFAKNVLKDLNNIWLGSDTVRHESVQKADFLAINETKLDKSFPTAQFNLLGFRTLSRKDITARSGGLLACVNGDIPSKMVSIRDGRSDIQILPFEMNLKKQKWLVAAIYNHLHNAKVTLLQN